MIVDLLEKWSSMDHSNCSGQMDGQVLLYICFESLSLSIEYFQYHSTAIVSTQSRLDEAPYLDYALKGASSSRAK